MASIRKRSNGTFELRVVHRNLEKPYYTTHDSEVDAERYAAKLKEALDRGQVPSELRPQQAKATPISQVLRHYLNDAPVSATDRPLVTFLQERLDVTDKGVTVLWVDSWVSSMKRKENLAPGTIRKRVESLARAMDWWYRRQHEADDIPSNPLRTLPIGYSKYMPSDGPVQKVDQRRDRRLADGESGRIESAILGMKRDDRQRPLAVPDKDQFLLLYRLIVNTGLRLREAYTLRKSDVRLDLRTIHVATSKTGAARDVPMTPLIYGWISSGPVPTTPGEFLFCFWSGEPGDLRRVTNRLSAQFARVFDYANCPDLTEHDLRHEAVCRWMLMRDDKGRWLFRPEEVRRITGHKSVQQFEAYLSLRGSDLADRLWESSEGATT